jgi:hypothetical protein
MLEVVKYCCPFLMRNFFTNEWLHKFSSVKLERENIIGKYYDFISSTFMQVDEILACQKFIRIVNV